MDRDKAPLINFIYGPDEYRVRQKVYSLLEEIKNRSKIPVNFHVADMALDNQALSARTALRNNSLFPESQFVWIKNVFSSKQSSKTLALLLEEFSASDHQDINLVVSDVGQESDFTKKDKELFSLLTGSASSVAKVSYLAGANLEVWIKQQFADLDRQIEPPAIKILVDYIGNETWLLAKEIEKLASAASEGVVKEEHVKTLTLKRLELNIFDLIEAIARRDKPAAMANLYMELATGRDPYYILTMLVYQFRNLLSVKDLASRSLTPSAIAQKAGIHPFTAQKTLANARKFELEELIKIYKKLLDMDTRTKNGLVNLTDALFEFAMA